MAADANAAIAMIVNKAAATDLVTVVVVRAMMYFFCILNYSIASSFQIPGSTYLYYIGKVVVTILRIY